MISTALFCAGDLEYYEDSWRLYDNDKLREISWILRRAIIISVLQRVESNMENCMCILLNFLQNTIQLRSLDDGKNLNY